jgi:predicted ATPase
VGDVDRGAVRVPPVQITELRLRHYRSVREAIVRLPSRLTYLVGPNGAGKRNVVDGLRFVSDSLTTSLDQALRERGGIQEIRWRSRGRQGDVSVDVGFAGGEMSGSYGFTVRSRQRGGFEVLGEACSVTYRGESRSRTADFTARSGSAVSSEPVLPLPGPDRLYLVTAASLPVFRPVFDALSRMGFYNLAILRG